MNREARFSATAFVATEIEIVADSVKEALGMELMPVEERDDGNRRQDERPQRFFRTSPAKVSAGEQGQRHAAYQDAYTDFERTVHVEHKARSSDADNEAGTRSKDRRVAILVFRPP